MTRYPLFFSISAAKGKFDEITGVPATIEKVRVPDVIPSFPKI